MFIICTKTCKHNPKGWPLAVAIKGSLVRDMETNPTPPKQQKKANKVFPWRVCLEALPTNLNLFKKKVVESLKSNLLRGRSISGSCLVEMHYSTRYLGPVFQKIQKSNFSKKIFLEIIEAMSFVFQKKEMEE